MFVVSSQAFESKLGKRTVQFVAFLSAIWGLTIFHPIVIIVAVSLVFCIIIYYGIIKLK